jgi:hypothetical protein
MEPNKTVFIDDAKLASDIQKKLADTGTHVDVKVIRLIMQMQTNNYENLGVIRIAYKKP